MILEPANWKKELSKIVQHQVATGADGTVRSAKYAQKFTLDGKAKWGTVKPGSRTGGKSNLVEYACVDLG